MPNVTLIDFTGKGRADENFHAAHLLIFTKSTRLNMSPGLLQKVQAMSMAEMSAELDYMAATIPSSWEFVDVTFLIEGVTRACAQQMTRTRTGSYAMQSQRVADLSGVEVTNPITPGAAAMDDEAARQREIFEQAWRRAVADYNDAILSGMAKEDARGLLPLNTQCNLVAKYNLRAFVDLVTARRSLRTQSEYRDIIESMEAQVKIAWPWSAPFFESKNEKAIRLLEEIANDLGITTGSGIGWQVAKAIDMLRSAR